MKKNVPLLILVGIVVLLAGILGFMALQQEKNAEPPRQANVPPEGTDAAKKKETAQDTSPEIKKEKTRSDIPQTDPQQGEIFVEGEVKAVDVEKRILTIDQHMDDNSVTITPNVTIAKDAIIQNNEMDISLAEVEPGDIVGMILTSERKARAVLINF